MVNEAERWSRALLIDLVKEGYYKANKPIDQVAVPYLFFKWCEASELMQPYLQRKIHEIIPKNSPKVFAEVTNGGGELLGYVMERIQGESLDSLYHSDRLSSYMSHTTKTKADLKSEISDAVAKLHGAGLIHGDIAPRNVLISRWSGTPILIDARGAQNRVNGDPGLGDLLRDDAYGVDDILHLIDDTS